MKSYIDIALHLENDHACSEVLFFYNYFVYIVNRFYFSTLDSN